MADDPVEKIIVNDLKTLLKNKSIKPKDLMEWSNSESRVDKNIQSDEIKIEVSGFFVSVKKTLDKRT